MLKVNLSFVAFVFFVFMSCSSHKKTTSAQNAGDTIAIAQAPEIIPSEIKSPYYNVNTQLDLYKKRISFYGINTVNAWELYIENDSSFTFILNGEKSIFEYSKPAQAQDAPVLRYYSKKLIHSTDTVQQKKSITITLMEQKYLDASTTSYYPFTVRVNIEDKGATAVYSGGGFYVCNPAINDIWVLDSINNQKVDASRFANDLPRLEFHLDGGSVFGFAGCNNITGSYYIIQNELHFNPLATTMKSCINMAGESEFLTVLSKNRFEYSFNNLRLTLKSRDNMRIVFKKVD